MSAMDKYTTMTILKKCLFLLPSIAIVLFMTSCNHVVNKDSYQYHLLKSLFLACELEEILFFRF